VLSATFSSQPRGYIVLIEPETGQISDLLRFNSAGLGTLYFFSDAAEAPEPGVLADGSLPTPRDNALILTESGAEGGVNGLFGYFASSGPGGSGSSFPTWDFYSDGRAPEPSSIGVLGLGGVLALMKRRHARPT